jgi:hypothetical protein
MAIAITTGIAGARWNWIVDFVWNFGLVGTCCRRVTSNNQSFFAPAFFSRLVLSLATIRRNRANFNPLSKLAVYFPYGSIKLESVATVQFMKSSLKLRNFSLN